MDASSSTTSTVWGFPVAMSKLRMPQSSAALLLARELQRQLEARHRQVRVAVARVGAGGAAVEHGVPVRDDRHVDAGADDADAEEAADQLEAQVVALVARLRVGERRADDGERLHDRTGAVRGVRIDDRDRAAVAMAEEDAARGD